MKYKMAFDGEGSIILVDEEGNDLLCIYWVSDHESYLGWPENFWYNPDWCSNDIGKHREANVDYHEHRDEYIAEAKKLLIKEML